MVPHQPWKEEEEHRATEAQLAAEHVDTLLADPQAVAEHRAAKAQLVAERRASLLSPVVVNLNTEAGAEDSQVRPWRYIRPRQVGGDKPRL